MSGLYDDPAGLGLEGDEDQLVRDAVNAAVRGGLDQEQEQEREREAAHADDGQDEGAGDQQMDAEDVQPDGEEGEPMEGMESSSSSSTRPAATAASYEACASVYLHPEYNALAQKYNDSIAHNLELSKQIEQLRNRLAKHEQVEQALSPHSVLPSLAATTASNGDEPVRQQSQPHPPPPHHYQPHREREQDENTDPSLTHHGYVDSDAKNPHAYLAKAAASHSHEDKLAEYRQEIVGWVRPVLSTDQVARMSNYFGTSAVNTNMQNAFVDLDGNKPTNDDWNKWLQDRRVVCNDILDPTKTWKDQSQDMITFACDIIEKRHPELAYCDDSRWKARNFLKRRVEQMGKVSGHGAGKNFRQKDGTPVPPSTTAAAAAAKATAASKKKKKRDDDDSTDAVARGDEENDAARQGSLQQQQEEGDGDDENGSIAVSTKPPKPKRPRKAKTSTPRSVRAPPSGQHGVDSNVDSTVPGTGEDVNIDERTEAIIRGTTDLLVSGGTYPSLSSAPPAPSPSASAHISGLPSTSSSSAAPAIASISSMSPAMPSAAEEATAAAAAAIAAAVNANSSFLDPVSGGLDPHYLAQMLQREGILSHRTSQTNEEGEGGDDEEMYDYEAYQHDGDGTGQGDEAAGEEDAGGEREEGGHREEGDQGQDQDHQAHEQEHERQDGDEDVALDPQLDQLDEFQQG